MAWPIPSDSKTQINRAGRILIEDSIDLDQSHWAFEVVNHWRSCHGYPINTFQATLRNKLRSIDRNALVAQRLKRMPSITEKLRRLEGMQLARMQDVGGIRAVVSTLKRVRLLEENYRSSRFQHELVTSRDYISDPKVSGYRSVHLIYRYKNQRAPEYDGLLLELQIRTKLQHAWATAVETMGTFLKHALKSSEGPKPWLDFFSLVGSAFAHLEKTPAIPKYQGLSREETFALVVETARQLGVRDSLLAYTVAAKRVQTNMKTGGYHLIVLDPTEKKVSIYSYKKEDLGTASRHYGQIEHRIADGELIQAVLVSAGPIEQLRRAYPNYFLDTREFLKQLYRIGKHVRTGVG